MGGVYWKIGEDEKLIKIFPKSSNDKLKKEFPNRTMHSINNRASRLGVHKDTKTVSLRKNMPKGKKHNNWKGGKCIKKGYIYTICKTHPKADRDGYVAEHRLKMEKFIGRYLNNNEVVHHINEIRTDNRIENLMLMERGEHTAIHHKGTKRSEETCKNISNSKTKITEVEND